MKNPVLVRRKGHRHLTTTRTSHRVEKQIDNAQPWLLHCPEALGEDDARNEESHRVSTSPQVACGSEEEWVILKMDELSAPPECAGFGVRSRLVALFA